MKKRVLFVFAYLAVMSSLVFGADDPMIRLTNETLQFFKPASGKILSVEGNTITAEMNTKDGLRTGMRLNILKEGEPFRHPVTNEILGRMESQAGKAEVRTIQGDQIAGTVVEGTARVGDKLRLSETKVKMVFIQDKTVDWYLGDDLYRKLKATGRVEMADTSLDTSDEKSAVQEARRLKAEVALVITAKEADKGTLLREQAFWAVDGSKFYDAEIKVDIAFTKDLKLGGEFFGGVSGEALFKYDLPFAARLVVTGDFDGDGKQEIALSTGTDVRTYIPGLDLKPLWELKGSASDDHLWVDTLDLNRNGRDELIITSMKNGEVYSTIFELAGVEFKKLWEGKFFTRKSGTGLIGQKYSQDEGFAGDVFEVVWDGSTYKAGERVKLPKGVNIYDFINLDGPANERFVLAYDEKGFISVFDEKGIRIWRSNSSVGSFYTTFKKKSPASYVQETEWSIKDRLSVRNKEVMVVQKIPLVEMAKGIGNKKSLIKAYWWSGFSMEESVLVDDVPGTLFDYALVGDKMVVLASPFLGFKFENILKGENPLGTLMYIYSARGR
ncbi:MAG: VCBS repeat-containing protein [Nitrospirota bacterium]|nr:VCBS repeat-containing protein [Nitrospirota bacterium]